MNDPSTLQKKVTRVVDLFNAHDATDTIITTSAGVSSTVIIDLLNKAQSKIPIVLIDTGFLFAQTKRFYKQLQEYYPYLCFDTLASTHNPQSYLQEGKIKDITQCCIDNKTSVLQYYMQQNKIKYWISAVRKEQTQQRKNLEFEKKTKDDVIKLHPLLLWSDRDIESYMLSNLLPTNPLFYEGYSSIGCYPCTTAGAKREGRWNGQKTECGLHTLI